MCIGEAGLSVERANPRPELGTSGPGAKPAKLPAPSPAPKARPAAPSQAPKATPAPQSKPSQKPSTARTGLPSGLSEEDIDLVARTLVGEAGGEGEKGMRAVAHVIHNRVMDGRFPDRPGAVATQGKDRKYAQFSTWNDPDAGGNTLTGREGKMYREARQIAIEVLSGKSKDPTGGATHYYAPAGMPGGKAPYWWESEASDGSKKIGGHIFAVRNGQRPPNKRGS